MSKVYPWDYHVDLTVERLSIIGQIISDARQTALELFDEEAGDNGWTLGCRAFQFARSQLVRIAERGDHPWLMIIDPSMRLTLRIGSVPVRFYRGLADEPTLRTLRQSNWELKQLCFIFDADDDGRDLAYRFAVETDADGSVLAIKFVGLSGETAVLNWNVPVDGDEETAGTVGSPATRSVEIPAPRVDVRGAAGTRRNASDS